MVGRLEETERMLAAAERAQASSAGASQGPPVGATVRLTDDVPAQIAMVRATAGWHLAQADWLGGRLAQAERALTDVVAPPGPPVRLSRPPPPAVSWPRCNRD